MNADEIRERYLRFFEARGHLREPSASLVPPPDDTSVLLTTAGMQPFKPYFRGDAVPPRSRLTSVQRCFRSTDIEEVGSTKRHLTFFEMLGNFSFGDYFKAEAIDFGWELSTSADGFGFDPEQVWVTVFAGDDDLGVGPDEEAIALWKAKGVPDERIVRLPRSENFWQAGPTGPCGPCSELYLDRGPDFGPDTERPGDPGERFLEYWNLVFMAMELHQDGSLTELPAKNIDTGLGLERMAAIQQGVDSVFETDAFAPLIDLAESTSGLKYGSSDKATRAMRILADHSRGMVNLIADGVVPSNEDRGYVLRRIMRRAIQQGRVIGLEAPYLGRFAETAIAQLGPVYPALEAERDSILRWVNDEEASFGRTLERGLKMLDELIAEARAAGATEVSAEDVFELHDTNGFPYDLTVELLGEHGLGTDAEAFEALMEGQRTRSRAGAASDGGDGGREALSQFAAQAGPSEFVGYTDLRVETAVASAEREDDGSVLVKLEQSPFYPEGGGQVSDDGVLRLAGSEGNGAEGGAAVSAVYRVGDDQVLRIDGTAGVEVEAGQRVVAEVDHFTRHATIRNHTATHLLQAALRERLGTHVRQAGSLVRADKLRFDFTHGAPLTAEEARDVENRVNGWIAESHRVRAMEMERQQAEELGAMALFGEKYGDWVRVVEIDGVSRELCGGTHVTNTAEIGVFKITTEGSSAANVRRIEAITGPAAIDWFREKSSQLDETRAILGGGDDPVAAANRAATRLAELEKQAAGSASAQVGELAGEIADSAEEAGDVKLAIARTDSLDPKAMKDLADRVRAKLGENGVVVLGRGGADGKVTLIAALGKGAVANGYSAGKIIRETAAVVGGGGGGRDDFAQAGGKDPAKLDEALATARASLTP